MLGALICHARPSPCLEMRKVLHLYSSRAERGVAHVDWADGAMCLKPCKPFQERVPMGFPWFRSVPGPRWFQLTGPPSGPSSCQDEEKTLNRGTVTGADGGRPRPSQLSFPTPCHWFPGRVTLVTPSFNLLQRAWPADHISRGWQQTLDYWSPNGNYYFLFGCFSERPRHGDIPGTGVCFEPQGTDTKTLGLWAKVSGPGGLLRGEIIKLWLINQKSVTK